MIQILVELSVKTGGEFSRVKIVYLALDHDLKQA